MTLAKTGLFSKDLQLTSSLFKALSHPARLRILQILSETQSCITGDISNDLPLGRTTVNQHLKELKDADLIQGHIEGVKTKYCLNPEKIKELKIMLQTFLEGLDTQNYKCE